MITIIAKVLAHGETQTIQKADGSQLTKSPILLQELGGKYADQYQTTLIGENAQKRFQKGDLVAASLYFTTHDYEGRTYQDIAVADIQTINNNHSL